MELPSVNCCIASTMLGFEDHGILTLFIYLDMGGSGVGYGGYCLSQRRDKHDQYSPTCGQMVGAILTVLEVDRWEDLPGKYCRLRPEPLAGDSAADCELGHIIKDKWISLRAIAKAAV